MDRRAVLGALGATAVGLAGWAGSQARGQAKPADDKAKAHERRHFERCAKACVDCLTQCEANFHHCVGLVTAGKKEHAKAMHLSIDCAELCATGGRLSARMSPLAFPACDACAKACDICAAECEKHPSDEHMKACASACRECAKECRTIIKHIGHDHHDKKEGK